jgi:hypothetical protein
MFLQNIMPELLQRTFDIQFDLGGGEMNLKIEMKLF